MAIKSFGNFQLCLEYLQAIRDRGVGDLFDCVYRSDRIIGRHIGVMGFTIIIGKFIDF